MRDLAALPKAHLHVHLESTVRPDTLAQIAAANGVGVPDLATGPFAGFAEFAEHQALVRNALCRREDFQRIAAEFAADEAASGTRYVEVTFTAAAHGERLGDLAMPLDGVLDGLAEAGSEHGVETRVILDHSRRRSVQRAWRTLELAEHYDQVIGIGVAGEERYPIRPFAEVFTAAREAGLHLIHHAGEASLTSLPDALKIGHAERIGHGIAALDDPRMVAELRDRRIPLEVCPSSNVMLGFAASLAEHQLPRMREAGLIVTVNSDIPVECGTTLAAEYGHLRAELGFSDEVIAELARAAVAASFAPEATKATIHAGIDDWLGRE